MTAPWIGKCLEMYGVPGAAEAYYASPARPPLTDEEWQQQQAKLTERRAYIRKVREERMKALNEQNKADSERLKPIGGGVEGTE
jgi:hypothetical protein